MEFVRQLLLFLHFIGLAVLIGAFVAQVATRPENGRYLPGTGMLHGALTQLVTGLALVGVLESGDDPVNHPKVGVKLLVVLAVLVLLVMGRRKPLAKGAFMAIGLLALVNVGVAVFWT
ncbi:hypothetical protein DPM19_19145 [Actinomadura craniellae]|uniref:Integral membrane protein n=1 Tax=Actinomadura craniellae TaxID=2231787 RepID=A0A365H3T8_9ACTN|nr:hypothetical protein [Actinomadura craniellae]RAY13770.1 hypothetical protein DPM19_19145 [Actinomadura craniellae]